jgi:hypothetical protein
MAKALLSGGGRWYGKQTVNDDEKHGTGAVSFDVPTR